jgi:hypothetical protein
MRAFLLGRMSEEEQERVEARVFGSDAAQEELLAFEEDLIDEYVGGGLSGPDRARFESYFLSSGRRERKVAVARAFAAGVAAEREPSKRAWLTSRCVQLPLAAAAGLAIVVAGWLALGRERPLVTPEDVQPQATRERVAVPDAVAPPSAPASTRVFSMQLVPGASRDVSGGTRVVVPPDTDALRVELRFQADGYRTFSADLRTVAGRGVWSEHNLTAKTFEGRKSIEVHWPGALLTADDYLLTLTGLTASGRREEVADYYFRVARNAR